MPDSSVEPDVPKELLETTALKATDWKRAQLADMDISQIFEYLASGHRPLNRMVEEYKIDKILFRNWDKYLIEDISDKPDDFDGKGETTDQFRFNRTDSEIEKSEDIQATKKQDNSYTNKKEPYPYTHQDDKQIKPESSLKHAMQDLEGRMMTKVRHELRLHNQQLFLRRVLRLSNV